MPTIRHTWFSIRAAHDQWIEISNRNQKHSWCYGVASEFCRCGRSVRSLTTETARLARVDNNTQDGKELIHGWCPLFFHSQCLIQTAIQGRVVITSLVEYGLSLCGVTSRDTRRALRAPFPRPYHNQRVELRLFRQRVKQQHQKKLGLVQHFRATGFLL